MNAATGPSLVVFLDDHPIFSSYRKWLHPLFELEEFLNAGKPDSAIDTGALSLRDRMVGKAAALLTLRLGIRKIHAETLSTLGKRALEAAGAEVTFDAEIDKVLCATEELLAEIEDPEEAYRLVRNRLEHRERAVR